MNEEESRKRQLTVLQKMLDLGMITQAEYDEAAAEDIYAHLVCQETAEEERKTGLSKQRYSRLRLT